MHVLAIYSIFIEYSKIAGFRYTGLINLAAADKPDLCDLANILLYF
jgi:hypothetical protein